MKKIKDGKLVLDGTITQNELQDKVNKAFEIVVDKDVNTGFLLKCKSVDEYNDMCDYIARNDGMYVACLTPKEFDLLKEVL